MLYKGKKKALANCDALKSVSFGNSVTTIGAEAVSHCKNLNSITVGKNVKNIGIKVFAKNKKCKVIKIKLKKLTKSSVANGAFSGISNDTVVKVPASKFKAYKKLLRKKGLEFNAFKKT